MKFLKAIAILIVISLCSITTQVNAKESNNDVAAIISGEKITFGQIREKAKLEVYEARKNLYDLEYAGLKSILIGKLIRLDPRSKGMDENQYLTQFVVIPKPVSDADVDKFIAVRNIPKERINTNLKEQARRLIMQQEIAQQIDVWYRTQIAKYGVKVMIEPPEEPRFRINTAGAAYRGGKNAKVTIVEFSDFECPYCAKVNDTLYELNRIYGNKIKVVYKHLPLSSLHPGAQKAAEASVCAQRQGMDKFWDLHNKMFENFRTLSEGRIKDFAKEINLDTAKFNQCLNQGEAVAQVRADLEEANKLGLSGTPAFFLNGRLYRGPRDVDAFRAEIDKELAR